MSLPSVAVLCARGTGLVRSVHGKEVPEVLPKPTA